MTWYWILAWENELLIDCDSEWQTERAERLIARAVRERRLEVKAVYKRPSYSPGASHVAVILMKPMDSMGRALWQGWIGDALRGLFDCARVYQKREIASLLIRSDADFIPGHKPEHVCHCAGKHDEPEIRKHCPVLRKLRQNVCTLFPIEPERKAKMWPDGKVPGKFWKGR